MYEEKNMSFGWVVGRVLLGWVWGHGGWGWIKNKVW